jgi:prepilin-type N-terminal cleavage/methylation domain-containing protein
MNHGRRSAAFTLLEVLMVVALLGLMAGLFISVARSFTDDKAKTPDDVFWQLVTQARKQALLTGRDVRVTYAAPTRDEPAALVMHQDGLDERFPFVGPIEVKIDFLSTEKARSTILVAGQIVETQTIPAVTFYGDGTCTPFRVQIRAGSAAARVLAIDPWTCAQVLTPAEATR